MTPHGQGHHEDSPTDAHDRTADHPPDRARPDRRLPWLPGKEPTDYDVYLSEGSEYETRFWRCRKCGQERNRREEFSGSCEVDRLRNPPMDGGYSIDEPRTRRALSEDMTVHFVERGLVYRVDSESGSTFRVDVEAESRTCPDHQDREVFCTHLRRVDLEIRTGVTPGPDGTFVR